MRQALLGALVGGGLTLLGGVLGAALLVFFEGRRARDAARSELSGAVTAVIYEMISDGGSLRDLADWTGRPMPKRLQTLAFERTALILARELPASLYATLNDTYSTLPLAQYRIDEWVRTDTISEQRREVLRDVAQSFAAAGKDLSEYAHEHLAVLKVQDSKLAEKAEVRREPW